MSKLLSVSIAAYNVEDTIEKCLDSFLPCHHLKDIEILVINDGSTDRTAEIVSDYEKRYPKSIQLINKKNGGHGSTLNKSLELAKGKYFKAVDGDDWVDPSELDRLCDYLEKSNVDIVIDDYREVYPSYNKVISFRGTCNIGEIYKFNELFINEQFESVYFVMSNSTVKTCKLREVGMHIQENCFYADTELYFFIGLAVEDMMFVDTVVYQYRLGNSGQSVSAAGYYKHIEDLIKIELNLMKLYTEHSNTLKSNVRDRYLFSIINTRYAAIFNCFIIIIQSHDKDQLLIDFNEKVKKEYSELYKKLYLKSIISRFVEKNIKNRLVLMRYVCNSFAFRFLRTIKRLKESSRK